MNWTEKDITDRGLKIDAYKEIKPKQRKQRIIKPKAIPPILETYLQQQCVRYARNFKDKIMCEGTPAQASRQKGGYLRMKAEGYITGSSDLKIYSAAKFIFVELKREKMGKMSPAQLEYQEQCKELGIAYFVIDTLDKFIELIEKEFNLNPKT